MTRTAAWGHSGGDGRARNSCAAWREQLHGDTVVVMDGRERAAAALLGEQRGGGDGRAGESGGGAALRGENSCMGKRSINNLEEVTFVVVLDGRRCCCFRCWWSETAFPRWREIDGTRRPTLLLLMMLVGWKVTAGAN